MAAKALELSSPMLPGAAVVGHGSKEAVPGLGKGGRGHTRVRCGAGNEWRANGLPELPRAPHCPRDAPDHAGRTGREQLLCSSSGSGAKARPPRVYMAAGNKLLPAGGSPVCCVPHQQRHECRKQSPPVSRGASGLASIGTQCPYPRKHIPDKVLCR